jgi:hypothetical protein
MLNESQQRRIATVPIIIRSLAAANHNETVVIRHGINLSNHNETIVIRHGIGTNHNETVVIRHGVNLGNHNETVVVPARRDDRPNDALVRPAMTVQ